MKQNAKSLNRQRVMKYAKTVQTQLNYCLKMQLHVWNHAWTSKSSDNFFICEFGNYTVKYVIHDLRKI